MILDGTLMVGNEGPCSYQNEELFNRHSNYLSAYSFMRYIASWKLNWETEREKINICSQLVSFWSQIIVNIWKKSALNISYELWPPLLSHVLGKVNETL